MTPPNEGLDSDEDSGAEDEVCMNNLTGRQLNAECSATFTTANCVKVTLESEHGTEDGVDVEPEVNDDTPIDETEQSITDKSMKCESESVNQVDHNQPPNNQGNKRCRRRSASCKSQAAENNQERQSCTKKRRRESSLPSSDSSGSSPAEPAATEQSNETPPATETELGNSGLKRRRSNNTSGKASGPNTKNITEAQGPGSKPRKWIRRDLKVGDDFLWNVEKPEFIKNEWSPVGLFQVFFDDDVVEKMCYFTQIYAQQKGNHHFTVSVQEMRAFLGILLASGYAPLPRRKMYWEQQNDVNNAAISSTMSRNWFEEILQYLHVSDNNLLTPGDKMAKVRPLFTMMNERFLQYNPQLQKLSVDESMIPYYGHHGCKQFIRGKPIRFGYKTWCLNTCTGYLLQCEPYQGAGTTPLDPSLGMGGSVVMNLLSKLPPDVHYTVFFDNLFTSLKLIDRLTQKGTGGTGTVRVNRLESCNLQDPKSMGKTARGTYDFKQDVANKLIVVRWNDNSVVTAVSNCCSIEPVQKAKRWSSALKKVIDVDQPNLINAYNSGMGGTDRMDQNISKYRISIRSKKWWWPLFAYMPDVAVQNAWLLYRMCPAYADRPLSLLDFRREIAQVYMSRHTAHHNAEALCHSLKHNVGHRIRLDRRVSADVRYDGLEHYPASNETQLRCASCKGKAKYKCIKCDVGLHIDCFAVYHTPGRA